MPIAAPAVDLQRRLNAPRGVEAGLQSHHDDVHAESAITSSSASFRPQANPTYRANHGHYNRSSGSHTAKIHAFASSPNGQSGLRASDSAASTESAPRIASLIAMDGRTNPPFGATTATTIPNHDEHPALTKTGDSEPSLIAPSFSQQSFSESRKNGHVRQPSSPAKARIETQAQLSRGHKRTATGDVKLGVSGVETQSKVKGLPGHSRTQSLDSTGSKIAELSAQLRARLSYAAFKVEKNWQVPQAGNASARSLKLDTTQIPKESVTGAQQSYNGSPEGTIISAPETGPTRTLSSTNETFDRARASMPPQSSTSLHTPKLAPPVNIITANKTHSARRRPNPNAVNSTPPYNPYPRHRRHHSEIERNTARSYNSNMATLAGRSPYSISASRSNGHSPGSMRSAKHSPIKRRTPSQNALMEQDAIETLLFMSSPENSGYHPNSQSRQTNVSTSIEAQIELGSNGGPQNSSQGSNLSSIGNPPAVNFLHSGAFPAAASIANNHSIGLEAQAGDEIDRLLDQMENENRNNTQMRLSYDFSPLGNQELGLYGADNLGGLRD
ncbi:hypothetical protein BGW36DRAFT_367047 [Talaromyces proteolyticus]|uniref:Uncharacterized protein n=1 Tax=Talaromyces proteolyticus TaxID=1131652 RepID=A0AAD4L3E7_9EURO|nr:uncharacterized protein BGW36DRAFT_367047 [Talaromyces proteolyticus]KAH8705188.1 hypothetical protein BGW36DRAFT_367047 [Talaromyces proteolyticus]